MATVSYITRLTAQLKTNLSIQKVAFIEIRLISENIIFSEDRIVHFNVSVPRCVPILVPFTVPLA